MLGSVGFVSTGAGELLILPVLPRVPSSPRPALPLPFPSRCHLCPCLERWGEQHLGVLFLETLPCLALDAFVDQPRRTGFHVDPAEPCARRFQEVERAGSREVSWEPTKADHQRCLVFAGRRIAERLNDSERMFHLKEVCFPAWLCISKLSLCCGPGLVSKGPKCSVFDGSQAQDCLGCGSQLQSRVVAVPALVPQTPACESASPRVLLGAALTLPHTHEGPSSLSLLSPAALV